MPVTEIFDGSRDSQPTRVKRRSGRAGRRQGIQTPDTSSKSDKSEHHQQYHPHRHVDEYSTVMRAEAPSHNPFDAFAAKPEHVGFDTQLEGEKILLLLRRHPITQLGWIAIVFVMLGLPFLFYSVGVLSFLPIQFHWAALLGWYLLVTGYALESFLTWFFNVYIVTDERIIDVDFYSLLYKNISSAKIDNIEDITATTGGALGSIFNFGTIKIQTAGAVGEFEFEDVPQPDKVTAFLNEMIVEEEQEKLEGRSR